MNGPHGPHGLSLWDLFSNPPPDPRGTQILPMVPKHCLYTGTLVETVKLNFHLELHVTLVCNLNSGLCLELQVFCESSFTQSLDRYWAAVGLPRGWSLYVILQGLS